MNKVKSDIYSQILEESIIDSSPSGINILLKHNYYSSDTPHGKELLINFLYVLSSESVNINNIYIIDSAVKLFGDSELNTLFQEFIIKAKYIYLCSESIDEYNIKLNEEPNYIYSESQLIFEQLLINKPDITIE